MEMPKEIRERDVDFVICVDKTGKMPCFYPWLENNLPKLWEMMQEEFKKTNSKVNHFRMKVIAFGQNDESDEPLSVSSFYSIPKQFDEVKAFLNNFKEKEDKVESSEGFSAMLEAMKSEWVTGEFDLQIIMLFTDKDAKALEDAKMSVLEDIWASCRPEYSLKERCKRLIIYAPERTRYFGLFWNRMQFCSVEPNRGLKEINFSELFYKFGGGINAI